MIFGDAIYKNGKILFPKDYGDGMIVVDDTWTATLRTNTKIVQGSYKVERISKVDHWVRIKLSNYLNLTFCVSFREQDIYDGYELPRVIAYGFVGYKTIDLWLDTDKAEVTLPEKEKEDGEDEVEVDHVRVK